MTHKIVVSVVAGFSLLGSTLVAAQCPPNLKADEMMTCIVTEGAGETYLPTLHTVEMQAQAAPAAVQQTQPVPAENGLWATAHNGYE